jgi:hypothetical protein
LAELWKPTCASEEEIVQFDGLFDRIRLIGFGCLSILDGCVAHARDSPDLLFQLPAF